MALDKKSVSMLAILGLVSAYLTLYTASAYSVARYAIDGGWRYSPSGSFLPWPRGPGMLPAISKMNESDLFIYRYLIKSWVLVGATILLWIVTSLYLLRRIVGRSVKGEKSTILRRAHGCICLATTFRDRVDQPVKENRKRRLGGRIFTA